jgi:hypothetical protein
MGGLIKRPDSQTVGDIGHTLTPTAGLLYRHVILFGLRIDETA